ncbi:MAG: protein phosphatase 2C family protein, partial [Terriglobus roseus]|nr:protein phosphatase 2C family protein [Terriglobus roseus]
MESQQRDRSRRSTEAEPPKAASATKKLITFKLASEKRRSFSSAGSALMGKMFGAKDTDGDTTMRSPGPSSSDNAATPNSINTSMADRTSPERKPTTTANDATPSSPATPTVEKKRRSSSVAKAKEIFSSAKQAFQPSNHGSNADKTSQTPIQKLSKADPALGVPQGSHNNSAGESAPGPRSTFRVGVTEDKNKKCRRTMEDTHAYLYNFLSTPQATASATSTDDVAATKVDTTSSNSASDLSEKGVAETDNGYFAIFDGHAGTFAADWCGKKLHHILEDTIRKNPNTPIPELLDQTFTSVDAQLEKLPLKNSGCTAVIAVLRWEDRVPNAASATGSTYLNTAAVKGVKSSEGGDSEKTPDAPAGAPPSSTSTDASSLTKDASRQRVLYTANVGDARIVLCRNGRALRLSYDHKGSDEQEGRRVANAGGLILNNRVNGVLAVTRALGDAYMKDLVTGHPYTTETVIQPDQDEFLILACDGVSFPPSNKKYPFLSLAKPYTNNGNTALGRLLRPRSRRPRPLNPGPAIRLQNPRRPRARPLLHRQPLLHDRPLRQQGHPPPPRGALHRRRGRPQYLQPRSL